MPDQIAVVNEMISQPLRALWDLETICFQGYGSPSTWESTEPERKSAKRDLYITIGINIYGNRNIRDIVGTTLSSAQLYLQHPWSMELGCEYDNPHFVSILNVQPNLSDDSMDKRKSGGYSMSSDQAEPHENEVQSDIQNEIAVVFNSLTRARCLKMLDADVRIKNPLLRYVPRTPIFQNDLISFGPCP